LTAGDHVERLVEAVRIGVHPQDLVDVDRKFEQVARAKVEAKILADPAVVKARADLSKVRRLGQPLDPEAEDIARELAADLH
jgi:collagenase-like PrtC family protease